MSSDVNLISHFISKFAGVIFQHLCAVSILREQMDKETSPEFSCVAIINRSCERSLLYRTVGGWQQNVCRIVVTCALCIQSWKLISQLAGRPNIRWVKDTKEVSKSVKINNWTKLLPRRRERKNVHSICSIHYEQLTGSYFYCHRLSRKFDVLQS